MRELVRFTTRVLIRSFGVWALGILGLAVIGAFLFAPKPLHPMLGAIHEYSAYLILLQIVANVHLLLFEPGFISWRLGREPSRTAYVLAAHVAIIPYLLLAWIPMATYFWLSAPSPFAWWWAAWIRLLDLTVLVLIYSMLHLYFRHALATLSMLILIWVVIPAQLASFGLTPETGWPILGRIIDAVGVFTALGESVDHLIKRDLLYMDPVWYGVLWVGLASFALHQRFRSMDFH